MNLFRKIGVTGAALLIAGACLITMGLFVISDSSDEKADKQEKIDTGYIGCLRYNDTRLLLRDIITDAYGTDSTPDFDLSALPQFQAIDDQAVKDLLLLLTSGGGSDTSTDRRDRSYARTGTRDCGAEYPKHSPDAAATTASTIPPPPLDGR